MEYIQIVKSKKRGRKPGGTSGVKFNLNALLGCEELSDFPMDLTNVDLGDEEEGPVLHSDPVSEKNEVQSDMIYYYLTFLVFKANPYIKESGFGDRLIQ